jgi:hypothetical protein
VRKGFLFGNFDASADGVVRIVHMAFVPLIVSEYSATISYPRAFAKERRSQNCDVLVIRARVTTDVLRDLLSMAHKFVTALEARRSPSRSRRKPV